MWNRSTSDNHVRRTIESFSPRDGLVAGVEHQYVIDGVMKRLYAPMPFVRSHAFVTSSTTNTAATQVTTPFPGLYMAWIRRSIMSADVLMPMTVMLPS